MGYSSTEVADIDACDQAEHEIELEEATPLGFAVQDVLTWLAGEHHEDLLWLEENNPSLGPERGRAELTLDVQPLAARYISRTSRNGVGEYPYAVTPYTSLADSSCHDSIALDVSLRISTAGGALAETVQTSLEVRASDFVAGRVLLPTDSLTGSVHADVQVPPAPALLGFMPRGVPNLVLDLRFSNLGSTGRLSLQSDTVSSDGQTLGQGGGGILARFPAGSSCLPGSIAVPADRTIRGVSAASVLQQLQHSSPMRLDGSMGMVELSFESSASSLCAILDAPEIGAVEFPGSITLRSSDQRIDGKIDVILAGQALAGVQNRSSAFAYTLLPSPVEVTAVSQYAVREPLDFIGYDGGAFRFSTEVTDADAFGELRVDGVDDDACVRAPSVSDPEGPSTPPGMGCHPRTALWLARWSQRR